MEKKTTSFWADIKKYEENLVKEPKSYCFAPLSELYRKVGLLDEAISTAKRGTDTHPEYIGGYMVLGRALIEKGMKEEGKISLERVARVTPENLLAQRLLSQIYMEEGNIAAAEKTLKLILSFNPEDIESRLSLDALKSRHDSDEIVVDESIRNLDDQPNASGIQCEYLQEDGRSRELLLDKEKADLFRVDFDQKNIDLSHVDNIDKSLDDESVEASVSVPVMTTTIAELYLAQGHYERALEIYANLLEADPENHELIVSHDAVRRRVLDELTIPSKPANRDDDLSFDIKDCDDYASNTGAEHNSLVCRVAENGRDDELLETMYKWLDSIGRMRGCR
jgi:tetratricopeptide (TPR) repeat protein